MTELKPVKSTLFYGLFVPIVNLLIATKSQSEFIKNYNLILLQLIKFNGSNSACTTSNNQVLSRIPLEIWERIKDHLLNLILDEVEKSLADYLSCECCRTGECIDFEGHRNELSYSREIHGHPLDLQVEMVGCRQCCFDSIETRFLLNEWIEKYHVMEKIPSFLSLFNLRLIDLYQIQEQDSNTLHIAIGVQHRIPQSCDVHNPNRESFENFVDILSTSTLLSLDYTELDRTFRKLRLIYGVGNSPSEFSTSEKSQIDKESNGLSNEDDSGKLNMVPAWRLWSRAYNGP